MQVMENVSCRYLEVSLEKQLLEPHMPQSRRERVVLGVHQHVDGMRGHDPVNKHTAEDNKVLYRMHGNSGPGPDIDVFVMEVMHQLKERRPVQETMDPIKVKYTNNWHEDQQQDEIDGMFSWIDVWQQLVGIGPHHQYFIRRPDRNSTATTPEDVVKELVSPEEFLLSGLQPLGIVFILAPL